MIKLICLGTGGWIPTDRRETSCYLVQTNKTLILLDSGTGIRRLNQYKEILSRFTELHVLLTHYHLDHIAGIPYLPNWVGEKKIIFYGPGFPLYDISCEKILCRYTQHPYFSLPISNFSSRTQFIDVSLRKFTIGDVEIRPVIQRHSAVSLGYTFDNAFHFATDTDLIDATFEAAADSKYLIHECWSIDAEKADHHGEHTGARQLAERLLQHNDISLSLIHINPNWRVSDELEALREFHGSSSVQILEDGDQLTF